MGKRQFKRESKGKKPAKIYIISTEGAKTEHIYFTYLKNMLRAKTIHVIPLPATDNKTMPEQVVRRILNKTDEKIRLSASCWAIVDYDDRDAREIQKAESLAERNKIEVLFSNPCFELWLSLHSESPKTSTTVDGCNRNVAKLLQVARFDKSDYDAAKFITNVQLAIQHAKRLDNNSSNILPNPPATRVYKLVELIMDDLSQ